MINQEKIQEIIDKTDIVALVSEYVQLVKAGSDYKGLCPFHSEKTPSFMVSPSKKIAMCMGCHKGGNPISFLKQIKNISFEQACIELAQRAGVELNIERKNQGPDYSRYYKMMEEASKFYHFNLISTQSGQEALKYLSNRGISEEIIKEFNIGLAPQKSDALYNTLKELGFNEIDMMDCGLIKQSENNDSFFDLFKHRIMFPVTDRSGHIIAFSGRIYNGETEQAKYINSPETVIFKKNQSIYHLDLAQPFILKSKRIILHEGQMDVIASTKAGLGEAVCSMGTALTKNQTKLLREFSENIVLCYDGDSAGVNAMVRAISLLRDENFNISIVRLPDGMDPDEYVNKFGIDKYKEYFDSHLESPNDYIYEYILGDKKKLTLDTIDNVKNKLFKFLNTLQSRVLVEGYLHRFSDDSNVSYASLILDFNSFIHQNGFIENKYKNEVSIKTNNKKIVSPEFNDEEWANMLYRQKAQIRLFRYAMKDKQKALQIDSYREGKTIVLNCFDKQHKNLWVSLINDYYEFNDKYNEGLFFKVLTEEEYTCLISDITALSRYGLDKIPLSDNDLELCLKAIFLSHDQKEFSDKTKEFKNLSSDEQKQILIEKVKLMQSVNKRKNTKKGD